MFFTLLILSFLSSVQSKQISSSRLKTYSVPCNSSAYCSYVELSLSANEFENRECLIKISLKVHNVNSNLPGSYQFSFKTQNKTLNHICTKYESGDTSAKVYAEPKTYITGSSIYMNKNLICTWIAEPFASRTLYGQLISNLMYNTNYSLVLKLNSVESIVTQNSSELPWHQPGYIECGGYQIYANDEYRVRIKKGTEQVQLWFEPSKRISKAVTVMLDYQIIRLDLICDYMRLIAYAYIKNFNKTRIVSYYPFDYSTCSVIILPDTFKCTDSFCSILNSTFDLIVRIDDKVLYSFHNLTLNNTLMNSGSTSFPNNFTITSLFISFLVLVQNHKS